MEQIAATTITDAISQQKYNHSTPNLSKNAISRDSAGRAGEEKDRKRIPGECEHYDSTSVKAFATELTTETVPSNCTATYNSLNKVRVKRGVSSESKIGILNTLTDLYIRAQQQAERLSETKLGVCPSTPKVLLNVNFNESEEAETPQNLMNFTSLCDLSLPSSLSQSVLDASNAEVSLDKSCRLSSPSRSMGSGAMSARGFSLSLTDKHVTSSVQPVPYLISHLSSPPKMRPSVTSYGKENDVEEFQSPDFKTPTSDLALVQPSASLTSHVAPSRRVPPSVSLLQFEDDEDLESDFMTPTSEMVSDQSTLLEKLRDVSVGSSYGIGDHTFIANLSKKMPDESLECEQIQSLLHHQHHKQVSLDRAVCELTDFQLTNPVANPLDLSERDQPSIRASHPPSEHSPLHSSHHCLPCPISCRQTTLSHNSADLTSSKDSCKDTETVFKNHKEGYGNAAHVTTHDPGIKQSQAAVNCMFHHVLPNSWEKNLDTGVSSELSDPDLSPVNRDNSTSGTKNLSG